MIKNEKGLERYINMLKMMESMLKRIEDLEKENTLLIAMVKEMIDD